MTTTETRAVTSDSLAGAPLRYSNEGGAGFDYTPAQFEVRVSGAMLRQLYGPARHVRLLAPPGWIVGEAERPVREPDATLTWRLRPAGEPPSCLVALRLLIERSDEDEAEIVHAVPVEIHGRTQFDPQRHALPFVNAAGGQDQAGLYVGEVTPSQEIFERTYRRAWLAGSFFRGLYSNVVFLANEPRQGRLGGLCTGIARSALEFSLRQPEGEIGQQDAAALRTMVTLWHGKQLGDRALLASTLAWLTRGSRDAYLTFRRDVLRRGVSEVAMDVNVPRPWRRDLVAALVGSGHTVVPYALRQQSDDRAEVWVYDPNHPQPEQMGESVIHFDLANNTYCYRHYDGSQPGRPSKVLAVRQDHYRASDTAYLSGLLSLILYPRAWRPRQWAVGTDATRPARTRWAIGALLVAFGVGLALRRVASAAAR